MRARFGTGAVCIALFFWVCSFPRVARAGTPDPRDLGAILDEATFERIGGCWPEAERKLLDVLRRTREGEPDDVRSRVLAELATLWLDRGDIGTAEALGREALEAAKSDTLRAAALSCLISVLTRSGRQDLELTETLDALIRISERRPDDTRLRAQTLRWQASVAILRKRNRDALSIIRIADALLVRTEPFSIERGSLLISYVNVLESLRDPLAVEVGESSCSMLERLAPEGHQLTQCLNNLAIARATNGDPDGALRDFLRSLALRERLAPGGRESARSLQNISSLHRRMGNLVDAEAAARRAFSASSSIGDRIVSLHRLRLVLSETGQRFLETEVLCQRDDLIEAQSSLSGSAANARNVIRSWDGVLTAELGTHLLRLGIPDAALTALERARARAFLFARQATRRRMLEGAPRSRERARLRGLYEAAKNRLTKLDAGTGGREADEARAEMFQLGMRLERSEVVELDRAVLRVRSAAEIVDELDAGTLALVYQRSNQDVLVLAVRRGQPLLGLELSVPWREIEPRIRRFLRLTTRSTEARPSPAFLEASRELACVLLGPVAHLVSGAKRLVISGDESLGSVPFSALVVDGTPGQPVFLAERLPVSHALSFTALLEGRLQESAPREGDLWCIGDPTTGSGQLPGARAEAHLVASLHPGPTRTLLGDAAQEALIKRIPPSAGTLHFACHASSNEETPEDSALLLAAPTKDSTENGELRAWEVANEMSLEADLVVLSACTSSSARDTGTEGPLGLARAFQIAGARRVLAARWRVPDEPTALFMEAFYSARARGLAADRCLQEAQVALLSNPETEHPYYWAGFVLHGDGR